MSEAPAVSFEIGESIARVTLNRPQAGNSMDLQFGRDLLAAAERCRDEAARVVVLSGAGKAFCFGGDLGGMASLEGEARRDYLLELTRNLHAAVACFVSLPAPVIAVVNGTAAGAGVGLVAMADLALAAESAKFSLAYTGVGLTPDGSTSYFLPRLVGPKRAMELVLTNRPLSAAEAVEWGLINRAVPDAALGEEAAALADRLASGPTGAYAEAKRLLRSTQPLMEQLDDEGRTISAQAITAEGREGISAFLAKRKPTFPR
ncbi:MAG: enoyl-CoA hydratase/isomerase family protein [Steroidobacteraceae bacterium]